MKTIPLQVLTHNIIPFIGGSHSENRKGNIGIFSEDEAAPTNLLHTLAEHYVGLNIMVRVSKAWQKIASAEQVKQSSKICATIEAVYSGHADANYQRGLYLKKLVEWNRCLLALRIYFSHVPEALHNMQKFELNYDTRRDGSKKNILHAALCPKACVSPSFVFFVFAMNDQHNLGLLGQKNENESTPITGFRRHYAGLTQSSIIEMGWDKKYKAVIEFIDKRTQQVPTAVASRETASIIHDRSQSVQNDFPIVPSVSTQIWNCLFQPFLNFFRWVINCLFG